MKNKTRFSYLQSKIKLIFFSVLFLSLLFLSGYTLIKYLEYDPTQIKFETTSSKMFDKNGEFLWEISKDNAVKNSPIKLDTLPRACIDGIIAIEDKTFLRNNGVDNNGLARLLYSIFITRGTSGGGSTISQQVIKTSFLSIYNRDLIDKYFEILYALKLNSVVSKEKILEMYLNNIYFGDLNYGIESASQNYFGKSSSNLNLAECAYITGIPQWPGVYNPYGQLEKGIERQKLVLKAMERENFISSEEYNQALNYELKFNLSASELRAPHFVQFVKESLQEKYPDKIYSSLNIQTTYDYNLHKNTLQILKDFITSNKEYNFNNGAIVILDSTNNIEVMIGSVDFFNDNINGKFNSSLGLRQPGSAYTPLIYMESLENGVIDGTEKEVNYDSLNLIKQLDSAKIETKFNDLKHFNTTYSKCKEILILEGCEMSLLDLTSIYSTNFNNSDNIKYLKSINDSFYNTQYLENDIFSTKFYKYNSAEKVKEILKNKEENGWIIQNGFVDNNKDSFIIGLSDKYTIGIWLGNTNGDEFEKIDSNSLKKLVYTISENLK